MTARDGVGFRGAVFQDILHFPDESSSPWKRRRLAAAPGFRHHGGMTARRSPRVYDSRLVRVVQLSRDPSIATRQGVPASTARGWLRQAPRHVVLDADDRLFLDLHRRLAKLERRCQRLAAILRLFVVLFRVLKPDLSHVRFVGLDKARLLRAVDRTRGVLRLRRALSLLGLSLSRFHAWARLGEGCQLDDQPSCPIETPQRMTPAEVMAMRQLATSEQYRHVPTGRLALLAQRLAIVFASTSTWYRFVKERGWRRPTLRIHPHSPVHGVRAERPNELWHIDVTVLRLRDGTRAYLSAVIDNYSRRILAWRLSERVCAINTIAVLLHAQKALDEGAPPPTLMADDGSENVNDKVDALVASGAMKRVLAQHEVLSSNSMIEAFWRQLKHNWLFLNDLDSMSRLRTLLEFYVDEHNSRIPHSAFEGQTPDEMYFGKGAAVPEELAQARHEARQARLEANRARRCVTCAS
jgi:transposase InsO family protein